MNEDLKHTYSNTVWAEILTLALNLTILTGQLAFVGLVRVWK